MASSNQVRQQLLAEFGDCVCAPDFCHDDRNDDGFCPPCVRLDPYWACFADESWVDAVEEVPTLSEEDRREIAVEVHQERTEDARSRYEENPDE